MGVVVLLILIMGHHFVDVMRLVWLNDPKGGGLGLGMGLW